MSGELINGLYRILGELRDAGRPGIRLAQSLVTGEIVLLSTAGREGEPPTADEIRQEGSVFGEIVNAHVHAVVDWNGEAPFIAWEYVPAWPLAAALRSAQLPAVAAVIRMMADVATGLGAVHARGAVYRGLHPNRILVGRDDSIRLATTPAALMTARGRVIEAGPPPDTPLYYLAPEQIEGVIDVRSDIYALAAVGYEALTGQKVHAHADPVSLAVHILKSEPTPPSVQRPGVPAEVDDLFAHCLARSPSDRPASTTALLAHLNKLLDGVAAPDSEPLSAGVGNQPVVFPLLAGDDAEAEIYGAIAAHAGTGARRSSTDARRTKESIVEGEVARLVGPGNASFTLEGKRAIIGRGDASGYAPEVDLAPLDHDKVVSREHAVLDFSEGGWYLSELKGRNGTWLNGERVRKAAFTRLRRGDRIRIANIDLAFLLDVPEGTEVSGR